MVSPGQPFITVQAKRSFDEVPVTFDWHDYLLNPRVIGGQVDVDYVWRPSRALATGLQYRCTTAGVTSPLDTASIIWSRAIGIVVDDGTAQWTSELLSLDSFRGIVGSYTYTPTTVSPGTGTLVLQDAGSFDQSYSVYAANGTSGESYHVQMDIIIVDVHTAVLTGEKKEGVAVLPVQD